MSLNGCNHPVLFLYGWQLCKLSETFAVSEGDFLIVATWVSYPETLLFTREFASNMSNHQRDNFLLALILSIQGRLAPLRLPPFLASRLQPVQWTAFLMLSYSPSHFGLSGCSPTRCAMPNG